MAAPLNVVDIGRIFWLRTDKVNMKGYCPVSLRLTLRGHRPAEVSTGVRCRPADWAGPEKNGPLKKSHPEYITDSQTLETLRLHVKVATRRLEALNLPVSPEAVAQLLKNPAALAEQADPCLLTFMEEELEVSYACGNRGTYESTLANVRKLRAWHGKKSLPLKSFTPTQVQAFYQQLLQAKARGGEISSANKTIGILSALFRRGVKKLKWAAADNPFACLDKKSAPKSKKVRLTSQEHQQVLALELAPSDKLWAARAAYLLQFYLRGERIGACLLLRWTHLSANGTRLSYQAQKRGPFKQVLVRPELACLLTQLRPRQEAGHLFILPFLPNGYDKLDARLQLNEVARSTQNINRHLAEIADLAQLDKKLRTHAVRHTFATLAAKKTGAREVQHMLGHTTLGMTETYLADLNEEELDTAADSVFDSLL